MLESPANVKAVALKGFFRVADRWGLSREERAVVLSASPRSISRWQNEGSTPELNRDQLERISYVLGIFSGLHTILGETSLADEWPTRHNRDFGDQRPLDRILAGNVGDLAFVRAYVDHWVSGW